MLGGGVVPGSLVLLGGEPGIGKSTLLLQAAANMARTIGPVLYSSGEESEHQIKSRGERLNGRQRAAVSARRDLPRADPRRDRAHQAGARHRRLGADGVLAEVPVGAGQHRPGARGRHAAAVRGERAEHPDVPRRPRHEGRQPRRPQGARARRRHRAVLRRRAPSLASRRSRGEEPLRRGQRARRVRDDVGRTAAGAESVEDCFSPSGHRTRRLGGAVLGRRLAADSRRSAGARQHEQLRHGASDGERHRSAAAVAAARRARKTRRSEPDGRRCVREHRRRDDDGRAGVRPRRARGDCVERSQPRHSADDRDVRRSRPRGRSPRHHAGGAARPRGGADGFHTLHHARGEHRSRRIASSRTTANCRRRARRRGAGRTLARVKPSERPSARALVGP